ncbi:hypothetical protein QOZ80_4AG0313410 [Eleusine coracana subsp. coracana]|nr:hypothetical protein QOZ80_4AG0313410 [Eleusine coracana subsp. coracana]
MARLFLAALLLVLGAYCVSPAAAGPRLSELARTLVVHASPKAGQVVHAGEDTITVTWRLNATSPAGSDDAGYAAVKLLLCYAPASQADRGWRKADDGDLSKDKACQRVIAQQPYAAGAGHAAFEYRVARDVPAASYHVRAYVLDASGAPVAYGETAPDYFHVAGDSGVTASIRVAAGVFSAVSVAALSVVLVVENRRKNK